MSTYEVMFASILQNPPDPNEPLPRANRSSTVHGATLPFLVLSWLAVAFRFWVRFRIVKEPGWDDAFVFMAALSNTTAMVCVCLAIEHGLGHHMLYIGVKNFEKYLLYFYIAHSTYVTESALIKISLLLQYLRIFRSGYMRLTCIVLLVLVSVWGLGFSVVAWFPCFPISGAWYRQINAKCYGFGFADTKSFAAMFEAHAATNMTFDVVIFLTPMVLFRTPNLCRRNAIPMAGVFCFGALVIAVAIWRLSKIVLTQAGTHPYIDFTWHAPLIVVLACLEISLAIICASMPIFWPMIERSFAAIFVSYSIEVTEERVDDFGFAYELEHAESRRSDSIESNGASSTYRLTKEAGHWAKSSYSIGPDPLSEEVTTGTGLSTNVETKSKPKWDL